MAQTTYYNLEKPPQGDYYDIEVLNSNADKIDAALHGIAEETAGKQDSLGFTPVPNSRKVNGKELSADITLSASDVGAPSTSDMSTANTNITVLQNAATPKLTTGTAPTFTVADTSVTAYADGLRRTIVAHADSGTNPTLNFNSKGAKSVYQSTGKAASWKAGQHIVVEYYGTAFFVCSPGGGVEFPATPAAGTTILHGKLGASFSATSTYASIGAGWGFVAQKAGTYRVMYSVMCLGNSGARYLKLQKNGSDVSDSEIYVNYTDISTSVSKTIDLTLNVGDQIKLFARATTVGTGYSSGLGGFIVSILATDVQTAINEMITPTTS